MSEPHDTDPLADTQDSGSGSGSGSGSEKKRVVHAGDTLGRYELVEEVGEGGMATVFRARDRELRRDVAVKVLFPHLAKRDDVVRRFHREARAAAGLDHPNILRVYDVGGGEGDPPYIVMELVRGRSLLGEIEQRGPMLAELAACVGSLLADALAAAHAAGVVHRDVKPANVMIASGGRVLLADFGVARLETEDSLVTKTGALLGTPAYMSPEQATGDTATAKSDLYSLGATLYQLATGALPYSGPPAKVLASIAQGSLVPPVKRKANVGPDLSRAIVDMMQADPAARPASATDIGKQLRTLATSGGLGDPAKELADYFADPDAFLTARTPTIVKTIVGEAKHALGDDKLPRALALADRATALAPEDPDVAALVQTVTEGGRAQRRRRVLAIVAAGVLVAGGAAFGVAKLAGGHDVAAARDASVVAIDAPRMIDAPPAPIVIDAATVVEAPVDAAVVRDAGRVHHVDAGAVAMIAIDGAPAPPVIVDAAPLVVIDALAPAPGAIVVHNDLWCDVKIDGTKRGGRNDTLRVDAGHHVVECEQPSGRWKREVDVAPGTTATVTGTMLGTIAIKLDVDTTIDGVPHKRGDVVQRKAGRTQIGDQWRDLREPCTVKADLECYP